MKHKFKFLTTNFRVKKIFDNSRKTNASVEKCTATYSTRSASQHCCNTSAFAFTRVLKFIGALTAHPAVSITTAAAEKCKKLFEVNNERRSPGGLELVLFMN